jgi:3-methylcrotonyl-CoA carboxylase alpha subunit/acetyl-CoA/propionyl-CoA carboxylase biotin carboxyl carrier protein
MIQTVLVANRGEIALRVFRTCRRLGLRTIAVYTDVDHEAPHVRAADEALRVDSYLDIEQVVAAAVASGADAVHPGYGFLSERAAFARAVEATDGLVLVGPSAEVMERMGRKDHAREIAVAAGVPVVPSYAVDADPTTFVLPVLVKAAAGGGGKGMRVVRSADEYAAATAAAAREARSAFGDDTLLVEKYVESGRHIEVQVLGDSHGEVIHLFERDCSTQRRHQKVLEEAPGPTVDPDLRHRLTSAAVALAREVGYTNAGTVEFLLDSATGDFYFLEMNTRLQVEHPVTELVCGGLDLVEEQLRVAAGAPLSLRQEDLALHGHAIEARVYAEDSFGGFLPQAGTTTLVRWGSGEGVRVDHALESGQVVSTSYDPMLGKVIAHGPDRESARRALLRALDDTAILGLTTNAGFLRALVDSDEFRDATIDTAWLDHHEVPAPDADVPRVMAAWVSAMLAATDTGHPFQSDGFRLGADPAPTLVELDRDVMVDRSAGTVDGVPVQQVSAENHVLELAIDGHTVHAVVNVQPDVVEVSYRGQRHVLTGPDRLAEAETAGDGTVVSPMPGTVLEIRVAEGDRVVEGDVLGMMEAMKMELTLKAPFVGTVRSVHAAVGDQVALGATLFEVEALDD